MRNHLLHVTLGLVVGATFFLGSAPDVHAAKKSKDSSTTQKAPKNKTEKNDSSESQAERDKRLYRECQGLPNAGACSGYTRR